MTSDPTAPPPEPVTQAHQPTDPWAGTPSTAPLPVTLPTVPAQFSAPPAQFSAPPAQFSAPPAAHWPASAPAGPYPPLPMSAQPALPPAGFGPAGAVAVQIGEITVSPPVIQTPAGVLPLTGAVWQVADYWQREEKVATWALVCAILGFFCLTFFSLFFLLVKETRHYGTVQVTVTSGTQQYVARIPVTDQGQVQHLNNQVNYVRSLSTV